MEGLTSRTEGPRPEGPCPGINGPRPGTYGTCPSANGARPGTKGPCPSNVTEGPRLGTKGPAFVTPR